MRVLIELGMGIDWELNIWKIEDRNKKEQKSLGDGGRLG